MEKQFSMIDFYVASVLITEGYELVDYFRQGGFTNFLFKDTSELHDYIKCYYYSKFN
jgi:hypothetical protein